MALYINLFLSLSIVSFQIWSGQAHYIVEPIYNFSASANVSIIMEGASAIALHIFVIYLQCYKFIPSQKAGYISMTQHEDVSMDRLDTDHNVFHSPLKDMILDDKKERQGKGKHPPHSNHFRFIIIANKCCTIYVYIY